MEDLVFQTKVPNFVNSLCDVPQDYMALPPVRIVLCDSLHHLNEGIRSTSTCTEPELQFIVV